MDNIEHTDVLNRTVSIGDPVVFKTNGSYAALKVGKVIGFTKKRVRIEYATPSGKALTTTLCYSYELILIPIEDYTAYILTYR